MKEYIMKYPGLEDLLIDYVFCMKNICTCRTHTHDYLSTLESRRVMIHDQILKMCEADRSDDEFGLKLAVYCEDILTYFSKAA